MLEGCIRNIAACGLPSSPTVTRGSMKLPTTGTPALLAMGPSASPILLTGGPTTATTPELTRLLYPLMASWTLAFVSIVTSFSIAPSMPPAALIFSMAISAPRVTAFPHTDVGPLMSCIFPIRSSFAAAIPVRPASSTTNTAQNNHFLVPFFMLFSLPLSNVFSALSGTPYAL